MRHREHHTERHRCHVTAHLAVTRVILSDSKRELKTKREVIRNGHTTVVSAGESAPHGGVHVKVWDVIALRTVAVGAAANVAHVYVHHHYGAAVCGELIGGQTQKAQATCNHTSKHSPQDLPTPGGFEVMYTGVVSHG